MPLKEVSWGRRQTQGSLGTGRDRMVYRNREKGQSFGFEGLAMVSNSQTAWVCRIPWRVHGCECVIGYTVSSAALITCCPT